MPINPTSFTSVNVENMQKAVLGLVSARPSLIEENNPPRTPGELVGYYNPGIDKVELFVASAGGTFWREVG
jgi:hypothetical protein